MYVHASYFSGVQLFTTLWTVAHQAPLSIGFSRQEYWSGLPCPSPGDLPNQGLNWVFYISCIGRWVLLPLAPPGKLINSVAQSCPTLCNPIDYSTPGFPVLHQLLELAQTHVHWVGDAIQQSHPLSYPSPPAFNLSQHQGLFHWVSGGQSIGISASASVFPINIQDWFLLRLTVWIFQSKGLSRVFSNTTLQKHQVFSTQLSLSSNSPIHTWLLEKP